jgi:hypothetical protein
MVRSNLRFKVVGLCALVFGLMAFGGTAAQAEPTASWVLINAKGELLKVGVPEDKLLPEVTISEVEKLPGTEERHLVLLTKVAGVATEILCTEAKLENAGGTGLPKLLLTGSLLGRGVFSGCITKLKGATSAPCKPHSAEAAEGIILTERVEGLIKLHELTGGVKDTTVLLAPEDKEGKLIETFVTLILGKAGVENECSIGEKLPISGELSIEDCNGLFQKEEVEHLIKEFAPLTDLWVLNKTAEHKATIDGSVWVRLEGEHKGLKWAGLPG